LNGDHTIISDLDIYEKVGHGVAYDEIVSFHVTNNAKILNHNSIESEIRGGKIKVEFIKVCSLSFKVIIIMSISIR